MKERTTLSRLRSEGREIRRNLIIDAAERIFASKPFTRVNIREIAAEAGIATSSIYTYFPNQEALFIEAMLRGAALLRDDLQRTLEASKGKNRIEKVVETFLDFFMTHEAYFSMMTHFMLHGDLLPESTEKINMALREILNVFDALFEKKGGATSTRIHSHTFFAALNGILISFRKYPGRSEEEVRAHMRKIGMIIAGLIKTA